MVVQIPPVVAVPLPAAQSWVPSVVQALRMLWPSKAVSSLVEVFALYERSTRAMVRLVAEEAVPLTVAVPASAS